MSRSWAPNANDADYGDGPEWPVDPPDPAENTAGFRSARERDLLIAAAEACGSADGAWDHRLYLADLAEELYEGEWT